MAAAGPRVFSQNQTSAVRRGVPFSWDDVFVFEFADGVATGVEQYVLDHPGIGRFWR
jgi:hypothetical protein